MTSIEVKEALLLAFRSRFWLISTEMTEIRVSYCFSLSLYCIVSNLFLIFTAIRKVSVALCKLQAPVRASMCSTHVTEPLIYAIE